MKRAVSTITSTERVLHQDTKQPVATEAAMMVVVLAALSAKLAAAARRLLL